MKIGAYIFIFSLMIACRAHGECSWCGVRFLNPIADTHILESKSLNWTQGELETNKIDILIAFDQSALRWLRKNGFDDMQLYAILAVEELNAGIANTELDEYFTFRLAGVYELPIDLADTSLSEIVIRAGRIFNKPSANLPEFKSLRYYRDQVAADIVAVLVDSDKEGIYGNSMPLTAEYISKKGLSEFSDYAYCACAIDSIRKRYTLLHEIGHIFGAGHGTDQVSSPGPQLYSYSSGFHFTVNGKRYTTVMGYLTDGSTDELECQRLPFFSSPTHTLLTSNPETGCLVDSGISVGSSKNDNTRTLYNTYRWVANFRVASLSPEFSNDDDIAEDNTDLEKSFFDIEIKYQNPRESIVIENSDSIRVQQFVQISLAVVSKTSYDSPVDIKVKRLPSGLKYDRKTGMITGMVKKTGRFEVEFIAKDKLKHTISKKIILQVDPLPSWAKGSFDGFVICQGQYSLIEMKINSSTGKINWAYKENGKTKKFSSKGFVDCIHTNGVIRELHIPNGGVIYPVEIEDFIGENIKIGNVSGISNGNLIQDTWLRKDLVTYKFKKFFKLVVNNEMFSDVLFENDYLDIKLSSKGKVRLSGKISGRRVVSTSQLLRLGAFKDKELVETYVVFPPKNKGKWQGCTFRCSFWLTIGDDGTVRAVEIKKLQRYD